MRAIIVGAGKVGFELARRLAEKDLDVIVIDEDEEALREVEEHLDVMTLQGNGASPDVLDRALIGKTKLFIAVTESDEANIVACMIAKQADAETTVARVRKPEYHGLKYRGLSAKRLGIDVVINPEEAVAREILEILKAPTADEVESFADGKVRMFGLTVQEGSPIANKNLAEQVITSGIVAAVLRGDDVLVPRGSTVIYPNDHIFVVSEATSPVELSWVTRNPSQSVRSVAILGGSRIGSYLARIIEKSWPHGPMVKLISDDEELCERLASELNKTVVICADGTMPDVLKEENIDHADVFIAVTGNEKTNLLAGFVAKELGIPKVLAEIYRDSYIPLAEKMGIDVPIVPRSTVTSTILRLVSTSNVAALSLVRQGAVEVMEIILTNKCIACDKPIQDLGFPEGAVIGAVIRNDSVIIPRGNTVLKTGDHVVVFMLPKTVSIIERYFR